MARNGSGTYSKVNTFTAGTSITAAGHNQNWDDLVAEVTNSVAVDGQSTMTGALKAASGTVAAPGITFGSDPDSGLYRIGANNLGVAVNGAKVIDVATTGATVVGDMNATTVKQGGVALLPVGLGPLPWSGATAPSLWVLAGATYTRATYPALWAFAEAQIALGNTFYTNGNGSTTFTIATMDGYAPAGADASAARIASFTAVGATAGAAALTLAANQIPTITSVNASQTITVGPTSKYVPVTAASSILSVPVPSTGSLQAPYGGLSDWLAQDARFTGSNSISVAYTNASQQTTSVIQPSRAFQFIVFAGA